MIHIKGKTHIGRRNNNEDRFVADADWGIALIADGMGGPEAGEVAAGIVSTTMVDRLDAGDRLEQAVAAAHAAVLDAVSAGQGAPGMGTTLVIAQFQGYDFRIAWIGDSRAYLWNGELRQLTRDHSAVEQEMMRSARHPGETSPNASKNLITRAMGFGRNKAEDVPTIRGTLGRRQQLLLCSDGLSDVLSGVEIATVMARQASVENTLEELIAGALAGGGRDNITAVLVSAEDDAPRHAAPTPAVSVARADGYSAHFLPGKEAA